MATTVEKRVIIIDVKGSTEAIKDIKALQKHAASADKNIARMGKTLGNLGFTIKAFIAYRLTAYIAGIGPAFINASDSVSLMKSRLDLVNDSTKATVTIMDELFDVAERSRGSIDSIATLYTRLSVSAKELGASQQEVMDFTELVSDTFLLSGATAGEAASGVTQISQAMAKGKLDGDEFKSVMENNVYFGEILADTLDVTRGELLELSKAGKITGSEMLKMGAALGDVQTKVSDMPTTFDQMKTAWANMAAKIISDSKDMNTLLARFNKSMAVTANKIGDAFSGGEDPIKIVNARIEDQIALVAELQAEVRATTPILGEHMTLWDRISKSAAPQAFERAANASRSALLDANRGLKDLRLELYNLQQDREFFGPEQPKDQPKPDTTDDKNKVKTLTDILKAYNKEQALANQYLWEASDAYQAGSISLAEYSHIYDSYSETVGLVAQSNEDYVAAQEKVNGIIEAGRTPLEEYTDAMAELSKIGQEFPSLADDVVKAQEAITQTFESKDMIKPIIDWQNTAEMAVKGVTGAFIDMAVSGENSFADFAKSFLINIAKMIAQAAVLKSLQGATGSGGLFGLFPSANGNVFRGGEVVPFAAGGVITSPTIFPMANGGIGLAGEEGAEAIIPLDRDASGKLGVNAEGLGGSTVVNINNYSTANATAQSSTDSNGVETIDVLIEQKVNAAMANGALDRSMSKNYNLRRTGY